MRIGSYDDKEFGGGEDGGSGSNVSNNDGNVVRHRNDCSYSPYKPCSENIDSWCPYREAHSNLSDMVSAKTGIPMDTPDYCNGACKCHDDESKEHSLSWFARERSGKPNVDESDRPDPSTDAVDELIRRLDYISNGLRVGDLDIKGARIVIDHIYDGIEEGLDNEYATHKVEQSTKGMLHAINPLDWVEFMNPEDSTESVDSNGTGLPDGINPSMRHDYDELMRSMSLIQWYLRKMKYDYIDDNDEYHRDPILSATNVAMLISVITDTIVNSDVVTNALMNPCNEVERDFDKGCLEDITREFTELLGHATTDYVVRYATRNWMEQFSDSILVDVMDTLINDDEIPVKQTRLEDGGFRLLVSVVDVDANKRREYIENMMSLDDDRG